MCRALKEEHRDLIFLPMCVVLMHQAADISIGKIDRIEERTAANLALQVVADYVAMTPEGRVFDSSLDKGRPYDFRVGAGQVSRSQPNF